MLEGLEAARTQLWQAFFFTRRFAERRGSTVLSIARITPSARVGTGPGWTRPEECVNHVDRTLCKRRLSTVFVIMKRTVGIGTESDRVAELALCSRGHAAASGCAARVPVMKPAKAI